MLYCSQCGARIPNNSKFCYKCGAKAVMPEWIEEEEELELPEEPAAEKPADTAESPAEHTETADRKITEPEEPLTAPGEAVPVSAADLSEDVPTAEPAAEEQAAAEENASSPETKEQEEMRYSEEPEASAEVPGSGAAGQPTAETEAAAETGMEPAAEPDEKEKDALAAAEETAAEPEPAEDMPSAVQEEKTEEESFSVQDTETERKDDSGQDAGESEIPVYEDHEPDAGSMTEQGFTVLPDNSPAVPASEEEKSERPDAAAAAEPEAESVSGSDAELQVTDNSGFILPVLDEYEPLEAYLPEETAAVSGHDLLTDDYQDPMLGVEYMTSVEEDLLRALEELRPVSIPEIAVHPASDTEKMLSVSAEKETSTENGTDSVLHAEKEEKTEETKAAGADGSSQDKIPGNTGISGIEDFNAVELAMQLTEGTDDEKQETPDAETGGQQTEEKISDEDAEYLSRFDSDPFGEDKDGGEKTGKSDSADRSSHGENVISAGIPPLPEIPSVRNDAAGGQVEQAQPRADSPINRHTRSSSGSSRGRSDGKKRTGLIVFIAILSLAAGFMGYYLSRPDTRYLRHMRKAADAESRGDIAAACEEYNLALEVMPESLQASEKLKDYWQEVSEEVDECTRRSQFREAAEQVKILKSIYPGREDEIAELSEKIYASWAAASVMTGNVNDVNYVLDLASAELDREKYERVVARSEDATARYRYAEDFTAAGKRILGLNESGERTAVFEQMDMFLQTVADYASQGGTFPVRTGSDAQGRQAAFYLYSGTDLQVYIGDFSDDGYREGTADSYAVFSGGDGSRYEFSTCEWVNDVPYGAFIATEYGNSVYDGVDRTAAGNLSDGFYAGTITITVPGGKSYSATFENGNAVVVSAEAPDGRRNVIGYTADGKDWYCISDDELGSRFGVLFVR